MPAQPPRDAEAAVGAYAPLLREMMLPAATKKEKGVPPAGWWLFASTKVRNPHVPPNARCVTATDFSYLTEIRDALAAGDKRRDLYVDGEEFGASAMVQSVRKEGPSGLRSKWCRQIAPLMPPQNDRYEDLEQVFPNETDSDQYDHCTDHFGAVLGSCPIKLNFNIFFLHFFLTIEDAQRRTSLRFTKIIIGAQATQASCS